MKILQITDLHINKVGEDSYGIDVRNNFITLLKAIQKETYDLLVISGDLCLNAGDKDVYVWIKDQLKVITKPYRIIPGNHDDVTLLSEVFGLHLNDQALFYKETFGHQLLFFLDTSNGEVTKTQLEWLKKEVPAIETKSLILFIHHPPCVSGVKFMDENYALKNIEEVQSLFSMYGNKEFYFFCGHCHVESYIRHDNQHVFITPSNYFQLDFESVDFKIAHKKIGYRCIELDNQCIKSAVKYL